jgi:rod shape-determining protein MreC
LVRRQLIFFSILLIIPIVFLSLHQSSKLIAAAHLSRILLFPIHKISQYGHYLFISHNTIEELEIGIQQLRLENAELRTRIEIDTVHWEPTRFEILKAYIAGRDPSDINSYLHINKGTEHGIRVNQPVMNAQGLVGVVKYADRGTSIIETIEHRGFTVSAVDINTNVHGVVKKRDNIVFDFVRKTDAVNVGDSVYTSGMSEVYPAGILIGTVQHIGTSDDMFFKPVSLLPSVQINQLAHVYLLQAIITAEERILLGTHDDTLTPEIGTQP